MAPIEDLDPSDPSVEIRRIVDYATTREALRRQEMHVGLDLDDASQLHRTRGTFVNMVVDDLNGPGGPSRFVAYALQPPTSGTDDDLSLGLTFTLPDGVKLDDPGVVFLRRSGQPGKAISVSEAAGTNRKPFDFLTAQSTPLPIRQDLVVQDPGTEPAAEAARVVVKLPLRFGDELLRRSVDQLDRYQIYRQFLDWEDVPVLVRDEQRPDVSISTSRRSSSRPSPGSSRTRRSTSSRTLPRSSGGSMGSSCRWARRRGRPFRSGVSSTGS